jgi:hypothetical protein
MAKIKQLPINTNPQITGYSSHAKTLAILSTDEHYLEWFLSNYIQLSAKKEFVIGGLNLDFYMGPAKDFNFYINNPWLFSQVIRKDIINTFSEHITNFIIQSIDLGYYVDIHLDQFYIPGLRGYQAFHFNHDNLIFGYNLLDRTFDAMGYKPAYSDLKITFDDFEIAYRHCPVELWYKVIYLYHYEKIRPGSQGDVYRFNMDLFVDSIKDYLFSKNSSEKFAMFDIVNPENAFGIEIYKYLTINLQSGNYWRDIRPLHILWEHKKCMLNKIEYLHKMKHITVHSFETIYAKYCVILKFTEILRQKQLKFMRSNQQNALDGLFAYLDEIAEKENQVLHELIECII